METLNENADFIKHSVDHSSYVSYETVHIPQSGANPAILTAPTSFPLTIRERTDTVRTYPMIQYALDPLRIGNLDELQTSYSKRQSVTGQQFSAMTQHIGNVVAVSWAASGSDNITVTTGSSVDTALPPSGTGFRKAITLADIIDLAKKMDADNIPEKGRILLMDTQMFWELHSISEIVRASYNGFQKNTLRSGVIAELYGFDIMKRNTVAVFSKLGTSAKAVGTAAAGDDRRACIAFHPSTVSRALGSITPMFDAGSNGNGKPEMLGSIFNIEVMLGSAILRDDMKGVASLVQAWVS
jgi:hypothetical protein